MAELPLAQGIDRFKQNEDRMDRFTNGSDTQTFTTSGGQTVPTIRKFLKDKDTEINAGADSILAQSELARNEAVDARVGSENARDDAVTAKTASESASEQSHAWAEGTLPGGAGTKSAKEWAEAAAEGFPADGSVTLASHADEGGGAGDYIADIPHAVPGWPMPAVLRTIFASHLSLKNSFGAKGDGLADDTAKLKDMEAWMNGGVKREITIENGRYLLNDTLTINKNGSTFKGSNRTATVFAQQGNRDTLVFKPNNPATEFLYDVSVEKIGIEHDFGGGGPTSGRGLFLQKCVNPVFDKFSVVHAFAGIDIEGGFGHQFPGLNIGGGYTWTNKKVGSFLLKLRSSSHNGSPQELAEIFFSDFNIKGASYPGNNYFLDNCVMIESVDGVWFNGGHLGFADSVQLVISAQATAGHNIQNVHFINTYIDGSFGGNVGIQAGGATGRTVRGIEFKGGAIKLLKSHAINWQLPANDVRIQGSEIYSCGGFGMILNGARDMHIEGNTIRDVNKNNAGSHGIDLTACGDFVVSGNTIGGAAHNVNWAILESTSVAKGIITGNVCSNYTQSGGIFVNTSSLVTSVNNVV
ncbi:right-handed parallel beta-helix repeat-containing protein [Rhizobium nepotum]|uniref:right-handed parallel beta-helix repeat-containing protein n=1 Tax=Rhizobium nepotum TaxID=1035271 RepID=UPI003CF4FF79